jgi:hypothetical protein
MNVVVRLLWFHCTVDPWTNPVPLIMTIADEAPATMLAGDVELIAGEGVCVDCCVLPPVDPVLTPLPPAQP